MPPFERLEREASPMPIRAIAFPPAAIAARTWRIFISINLDSLTVDRHSTSSRNRSYSRTLFQATQSRQLNSLKEKSKHFLAIVEKLEINADRCAGLVAVGRAVSLGRNEVSSRHRNECISDPFGHYPLAIAGNRGEKKHGLRTVRIQ
jgi:hypothetical protein